MRLCFVRTGSERSMGEPLAELHSTIISSDVMRKSGDARGVCGGFGDVGEALKHSGIEAKETCDCRPRRQLTGNDAGNGTSNEATDDATDGARDVKS